MSDKPPCGRAYATRHLAADMRAKDEALIEAIRQSSDTRTRQMLALADAEEAEACASLTLTEGGGA